MAGCANPQRLNVNTLSVGFRPLPQTTRLRLSVETRGDSTVHCSVLSSTVAAAMSACAPSLLTSTLGGGIGSMLGVCIHWRQPSRAPITVRDFGWSIVAFVLGGAAGAYVSQGGYDAAYTIVAGVVVATAIEDAEYARLFMKKLANRLGEDE